MRLFEQSHESIVEGGTYLEFLLCDVHPDVRGWLIGKPLPEGPTPCFAHDLVQTFIEHELRQPYLTVQFLVNCRMRISSKVPLVELIRHVDYHRPVRAHGRLQFPWDLLEYRLLESCSARRWWRSLLLLHDPNEGLGGQPLRGSLDSPLIA